MMTDMLLPLPRGGPIIKVMSLETPFTKLMEVRFIHYTLKSFTQKVLFDRLHSFFPKTSICIRNASAKARLFKTRQ